MRTKQTARKSTAGPVRGSATPDPLRHQIRGLLETKRKSTTPSFVKTKSQVKTKPRATPGQAALAEIKRLQDDYSLQIPRAPFHRLVRDITQCIVPQDELSGFKYQAAALQALQEAAESFLVRLYEDSYLCTIHAKRVTLFVSDMQLCRRLQNN